MKHIAVIGVGYVGLTTAACLAELGHHVTGVDMDEGKIVLLRQGQIPFIEPELPELVERNVRAGRLDFTTSYQEAMQHADMAFICVGTPPTPSGHADMSQVEEAARQVALAATQSLVVVLKSTTPPGGNAERVAAILANHLSPGIDAPLVVNPEFLREGSAVYDTFHPDRVVIGAWDAAAAERVAALYAPLRCPALLTDPASAQLTKYASNAFLATKISFINEISRIAERVGANIHAIAQGMGFDERIGAEFLESGLGYGGSCFPKDVLALSAIAEQQGYYSQFLHAVTDINAGQCRLAVEKLGDALGGFHGKAVCVLGLAFKPQTDDVRESPALSVISMLCQQGAVVQAYDPAAISTAQKVLPPHAALEYCADAYAAARGCHAVLIPTNWPEFRSLDWSRVHASMAGKAVMDGRGLLSPDEMRGMGFEYLAFAN